MRRKDLAGGQHIDPGYYILDGAEGDPEALVVQGPFPMTPAGRVQAERWGEQCAKRIGHGVSLVQVIPIPGS